MEYLKGCDMASFDIYPVAHDAPEVKGKLEFVGKIDFSDRCVDRDLQLGLIHLSQRRFNDLVVALIGVDQKRIVDGVGGDPDVLQ